MLRTVRSRARRPSRLLLRRCECLAHIVFGCVLHPLTPPYHHPPQMKKMLKEKEAVEAELARLARPIIKQAAVPAGVDPKSVLCEFFKVRPLRALRCAPAPDRRLTSPPFTPSLSRLECAKRAPSASSGTI